MPTWLRAIPLLIFPALLYAVIAMPMDEGAVRGSLDRIFYAETLPSGALFLVSRGHVLTMLAAGLLFFEIIKSTHATTTTLIENGLAFLSFTVAFSFFLLHSASAPSNLRLSPL